MRLLVLPFWATLTVDILSWFVIQMGVSLAVTKMSDARFRPGSRLFRPRAWEREGRVYETAFRIKKWKGRIPDAAPWFQGGFPKKRLVSLTPEYLERFIRETCRGESAHWIVLALSPAFFLWNSPWVGWLMLAYAAASNLPCILTQRYNRLRLRSINPNAV
jgi:glycosyl-4,4'-diaponeurosporenoate acyltransferase